MKKKVIDQINTLAKRILESENEIDIPELKNSLIQLYEKLSVLEFLESSVEAEFKKPERPSRDSKTFREENWFKEPDPVPQPTHDDALVEPLMDKIRDLVSQIPKGNTPVEELIQQITPETEVEKTEIEHIAKEYQEMPIFERKIGSADKPVSLNDKLSQEINIGLNDRIAFIKHLFNGSQEDYTRVISQINTMTSFEEVGAFLESTVKLDYANWEGKEEFANRFYTILEKRYL